MKKYSISLLVVLTALLFVCPVYAVGFDGQTLQVQWLFPDINTVNYNGGNAVVGPGVEFPNFHSTFPYIIDIDISSNQIAVSLSGNQFAFTSSSFNGFLFTDIFGTVDTITGVTIDSSTVFPGLDASRISFDADHIWINLQNLPTDSLSHSALFDVAFSTNTVPTPTPEPTTMLLLGLGLIGLAGTRRKFKE